MSDDRIEVLLQEELDGVISHADAAELARLLEASPNAAAEREALHRVHQALSETPEVDPPAGFHDAVMGAIPMRQRTPARASGKPGGRWWLPEVPAFFRYGMAAMAGLVVAIGIYEIVPQVAAPVDPRDAVGTMMNSDPASAVLDQIEVSDPRLSGQVTLQRQGEALYVEVALTSSAAVELELAIDGGGITFDTLAPAGSDTLSLDKLKFSEREVGGLLAGNQKLLVKLDAVGAQDPASIRIVVRDQEGSLWEAELSHSPHSR